MGIPQLRSKRILIPAAAAALALGLGGVVWASTASADIDGNERARVAAAATEAVGGGTVTDVEASDDRGEAYEVEVRRADGTEIDVKLDQDLDVIDQSTDDRDGRDDGADDAGDRGARDDDDLALSSPDRTRAEQAALAAVGGGTVTDVERSDDRGEAYEVDVRKADGAEWDVTLDSGFEVLRKHLDD